MEKNFPVALLELVYFQVHLAEGGKKDKTKSHSLLVMN